MHETRQRLRDVAHRLGYSPEYLQKLARAGTLRTEQRKPRAHHFVTESEVRRALRTEKNGEER